MRYNMETESLLRRSAGKARNLGHSYVGSAHLLLAMAAERNHAPQPVLWQARENGKPYLADGPHFSHSHSGDIVLCAVYDAEVGVDVEMPRKIVPGLRRKILSDREKACETEGLLTAWVAKESYLKYTGEGLRRAMTEFSVQSGAVIDGEGVYQASVQRVALPVEGAIACVCTGQKDELCIRQLFWKGEE